MPGKPLEQLAEDGVGVGITVDDDVVRGEVVERLGCPLRL